MYDHPPGGLADRQLTYAAKQQNESKLPQKEEAARVINFQSANTRKSQKITCRLQAIPEPAF